MINNILRLAKWFVFVTEMNLLLPCFGLSATYLPTPDPARRPGITPTPYTKHVLLSLWLKLVQSQRKRVAPPPFSNLSILLDYGVLYDPLLQVSREGEWLVIRERTGVLTTQNGTQQIRERRVRITEEELAKLEELGY